MRDHTIFVRISKSEEWLDFGGWNGLEKLDVRIGSGNNLFAHVARYYDYSFKSTDIWVMNVQI